MVLAGYVARNSFCESSHLGVVPVNGSDTNSGVLSSRYWRLSGSIRNSRNCFASATWGDFALMNFVGPAGWTGCSWLPNVGIGKNPNDEALTAGKSFSTCAAFESSATDIAYLPPARAAVVSAKA